MTCKCYHCNYVTHYVANFNKHLETKKHKYNTLVTPKSPLSHPKVTFEPPNVSDKIKCKYCEQEFKFKQSMYRHIKFSCTKNKEEDLKELVRLMNSQMELQKNDFQAQLQSQSKQIEKLMGKLEIKGSFNNTTNIQNITLNSYNNTDISHITDQDYRNCVKKVCYSVLKLIEKIHFNPNKPENMNIYISNMKDKYLMVYEEGLWILKNKNNEINKLYADKELMIEEWIDNNKEPEMQQFFDRYLNNKKDMGTLEDINDQLKLMMYNKKPLKIE